MGERTPGLNGSPRATVEELGSEIAGVREELDTLLGELDRRRHEALDVPLQLRRHALGASLVALSVVAITATGVRMAVSRRRRRRRWPDRWQDRAAALQQALARITAHPERVAVTPSPGLAQKLVAAAATAAVASLVKKLLEPGLAQAIDPPAPRPAPRPRSVTEEAL